MGQIKHYNNGKWTIYTSGEGLSGYTGVTNTYYVGPDLNNDGNLTKANPDGTLVNLEKDTRPYKVYTALLSQSGTSDPIAIVLENTIGNIIWTRTSFGIYKGTLVGAFIRDKAICPPYSSNFNDVGNSSVFLPLSTNGNPQLGWVNAYFGGTNNEDYLRIDTYDMSGRVEWSSIIGDGNLPIEIRVYN